MRSATVISVAACIRVRPISGRAPKRQSSSRSACSSTSSRASISATVSRMAMAVAVSITSCDVAPLWTAAASPACAFICSGVSSIRPAGAALNIGLVGLAEWHTVQRS